ncbi:hypothetical protein [[Phormidium] sp. ETS-05]|uniref:hypothetical protein n=1 Tax=[Phormidium] sp. ETS-05 TaxID=222819 RepID=UPI0018EF286F|nr:hypothetical protein [[Phormidium] sp. ETS-05]
MSKYQKTPDWSATGNGRSATGVAPPSSVEVRQHRRHLWKSGLLSSIGFTRLLVISIAALVVTLVWAGTPAGAVSPHSPHPSAPPTPCPVLLPLLPSPELGGG